VLGVFHIDGQPIKTEELAGDGLGGGIRSRAPSSANSLSSTHCPRSVVRPHRTKLRKSKYFQI